MVQKVLKRKRNIFLNEIPRNVIFGLLFLLVTIILLNFQTNKSNSEASAKETQKNYTLKSITELQKIVKEKPDYRDGWIHLSAAYLQAGNKLKSLEALLKAKTIDPNNETIKSLEDIILNKEK